MNRPLILIVEDDAVMRGVLTVALRGNGYDVKPAATGRAAIEEVELRTPDAVILDLGLPDMDGFDVTASIREKHEVPIIVLSARDEEQHQIRALDGGANDYVTKPFREGELMARLRAALRRPTALAERREIHVGDVYIEALQRRVFVGDEEVTLTPTEFKLLYVLACESDRVVTHQQLLRSVWGPSKAEDVHYLRVYMKHLRQKMETNPSRPERILTALGVGYQLVDAESPLRARQGKPQPPSQPVDADDG